MKPTANNYAFIDAQNLHLNTQLTGWKVDYRRLRQYLRTRFSVQRAFMFFGYLPEREKMYQYLRACGFELCFRDVIRVEGEKPKGNVDGALIVYAMEHVASYDNAVLISADGDFAELVDYFHRHNKIRSSG